MSKVPGRFIQFMDAYPAIGKAYEDMSSAVAEAGPLDAKSCALVKLGISIGARMEGTVHSHVRKALEAGCTPEEIRHATLQAITTIGFPNMMAARSWAESVLNESKE